jgi:hypothetical protein
MRVGVAVPQWLLPRAYNTMEYRSKREKVAGELFTSAHNIPTNVFSISFVTLPSHTVHQFHREASNLNMSVVR